MWAWVCLCCFTYLAVELQVGTARKVQSHSGCVRRLVLDVVHYDGLLLQLVCCRRLRVQERTIFPRVYILSHDRFHCVATVAVGPTRCAVAFGHCHGILGLLGLLGPLFCAGRHVQLDAIPGSNLANGDWYVSKCGDELPVVLGAGDRASVS